MEGIILRTSLLNLDVQLSPHPASDLIRAWFPFAHVNIIVATLMDCD